MVVVGASAGDDEQKVGVVVGVVGMMVGVVVGVVIVSHSLYQGVAVPGTDDYDKEVVLAAAAEIVVVPGATGDDEEMVLAAVVADIVVPGAANDDEEVAFATAAADVAVPGADDNKEEGGASMTYPFLPGGQLIVVLRRRRCQRGSNGHQCCQQ